MAKHKPKDVYMQFKDLTVTYGPASDVLVEANVDTGLSIRGELCWLIHGIEWFFLDAGGGQPRQTAVISTLKGRTQMPALGDKGTLSKVCYESREVTSGMRSVMMPFMQSYLPPVPIAAPSLSVYAICNINATVIRNTDLQARLLFTTTPMNSALYTEIAETWGW